MNDINPAPDQQRELSSDERNWGMLCHLSMIVGIVMPLVGVVAPLAIWLIKREEMPFVDYNGKEALNFLITFTIALLIGYALMSVLIGLVLVPLLYAVSLVLTILAAVKSSKGEYYRYPYILHLIN